AHAVGPVDTPLLFAIILVESDKVGLGILIAVKDHEVLVENRRAAKAMARIELAGYLLPLQVAVARVAGYKHLGYGMLGDVLRLAWRPRQVVVFFAFA